MLDALLETIGTLAVLASIAAKFLYARADTDAAAESSAVNSED
ncbi:hypothetical protein [Massilia rubra]|nr:hypothetical protein [Massilia rubra]